MENNRPSDPERHNYFSTLGFQVRDMLKMHKLHGLWGDKANPKENWRNVTKHCLAEVARCDVLADALGFSAEGKTMIKDAAALHDFFKKEETGILRQARAEGASEFDAFDTSEAAAKKAMEENGIDPNIIAIVQAIGHPSVPEIEKLLQKEELTEVEKAMLVLHFVDDVSMDDKPVTPSTVVGDTRKNILDLRLDALEANPKYAKLNEEGRAHFDGLTSYQAQRKTGHGVEQKLTDLIAAQGTLNVEDPLLLAETVEAEIERRIRQ